MKFKKLEIFVLCRLIVRRCYVMESFVANANDFSYTYNLKIAITFICRFIKIFNNDLF